VFWHDQYLEREGYNCDQTGISLQRVLLSAIFTQEIVCELLQGGLRQQVILALTADLCGLKIPLNRFNADLGGFSAFEQRKERR